MPRESLYTGERPLEGSFMANTVKELKELLDLFPDSLPVECDGVFLQWNNVGLREIGQKEHLAISTDDPMDDEDDEDDWDDEEYAEAEPDDDCEWDDTDEEETSEDDYEDDASG